MSALDRQKAVSVMLLLLVILWKQFFDIAKLGRCPECLSQDATVTHRKRPIGVAQYAPE